MKKWKTTVLGFLACWCWAACNQGLEIRDISPSVGLVSGGEQVEIIGSGFDPTMGVSVYFADRQADNVVVSSTDKLVIMTPAHSKPEPVDIRIAMDNGREFLIRDGFRYVEKASMDIRDLGKRRSLRDQQ